MFQWRALARYRQIGAPGLLTADRPRGTIFGRQDELAREAVLTRLIETPRCVLGEFEQLAQLLELLGDRLAFLCSWLLEFFLDRLGRRRRGEVCRDRFNQPRSASDSGRSVPIR